jgi:hypothetical protein
MVQHRRHWKLDERGYFYFVDRANDYLWRGGEKI